MLRFEARSPGQQLKRNKDFRHRKRKALFLGISLLLITSKILSAESLFPIPQGFMFEGKPVAPACIGKFSGDSSRFEPIFLKSDKCQNTKKEYNPQKLKEGFLGYSPLYEEALGSYIDYKYLGKLHFQNLKSPIYHLIYVRWSGGGTGQFTAIHIVEKTEDWIRLIDTLDEG